MMSVIDELLGLVLKEDFDETNRQFDEAVSMARQGGTSNSPVELLSSRMAHEDRQQRHVSNEIYLYLISQRAKPAVRRILAEGSVGIYIGHTKTTVGETLRVFQRRE